MIRFKVVRASHLLLAASIVLLLAVLVLLGIKLFSQRQSPPVGGSANLVDAASQEEAKTVWVFASSDHATSANSEIEPVKIEIIAPVPTEKPAPRVLIYHTHTHEAYEQISDDPYEALEAWRTEDSDHSVVRVGGELAGQLEQLGFDVTHDTTDHEGNELSTAYTRSLETLRGYAEFFDLYIDLHRDAYMRGEEVSVKAHNGEALAPLMMLIGNGNGFEEKPWYAENYAFACALEARINREEPGLCKPVMVKDGRYNQHIGVFSILVEVGHNHNTLRQALNSVPMLARAIRSLLIDESEPSLIRMKDNWVEKHRH